MRGVRVAARRMAVGLMVANGQRGFVTLVCKKGGGEERGNEWCCFGDGVVAGQLARLVCQLEPEHACTLFRVQGQGVGAMYWMNFIVKA